MQQKLNFEYNHYLKALWSEMNQRALQNLIYKKMCQFF